MPVSSPFAGAAAEATAARTVNFANERGEAPPVCRLIFVFLRHSSSSRACALPCTLAQKAAASSMVSFRFRYQTSHATFIWSRRREGTASQRQLAAKMLPALIGPAAPVRAPVLQRLSSSFGGISFTLDSGQHGGGGNNAGGGNGDGDLHRGSNTATRAESSGGEPLQYRVDFEQVFWTVLHRRDGGGSGDRQTCATAATPAFRLNFQVGRFGFDSVAAAQSLITTCRRQRHSDARMRILQQIRAGTCFLQHLHTTSRSCQAAPLIHGFPSPSRLERHLWRRSLRHRHWAAHRGRACRQFHWAAAAGSALQPRKRRCGERRERTSLRSVTMLMMQVIRFGAVLMANHDALDAGRVWREHAIC